MEDTLSLARRIERLETHNRRMRKLLLLVVVTVCGMFLMGQVRVPPTRVESGAPADGKVRAEAFILTDAKGNERASLVTDGTGSVFLVMFDKDGKARADMQVNSYGPSINFYDPNAKTRLVIGSTTLVASHVSNNGIMEKNTPSSIVMMDAAGQLLWRTP
jgi:hypothetical protein